MKSVKASRIQDRIINRMDAEAARRPKLVEISKIDEAATILEAASRRSHFIYSVPGSTKTGKKIVPSFLIG